MKRREKQSDLKAFRPAKIRFFEKKTWVSTQHMEVMSSFSILQGVIKSLNLRIAHKNPLITLFHGFDKLFASLPFSLFVICV